MAERIRFSASILRRLGEELNPNVDQGIIELVKNAYDADATTCLVTLAGPDEGDYVEVEDDGKGMTSADIIDGWLVLGSSNKSTGARTGKGRTPAGNKGLGRLAALRLGHEAEMRSTVLGVPSQEVVRLEWDRFDEAGIVEEVPVAIEKQPADVSRQGTTITVRRLRRAITRPEVKRLARAMILLADPFADANSGFEPKLNASDFADLARLVEMRYFEEAEYHLIARLEGGLASAEIQDWRGDTLFRGSHSDVAPDGDHRYVTVDATFELWAYSLSGASFQSRIASLSEVREWLAAFGGVHVYANGIRVAPYGNAGDDWLEMNLARVRSPEERPSTNNSIGRIRFEDPEGRLEQKTDRSGFIESEAVENLRLFGRDALEWMARVRLREAERRRTRARLEKPSQTEQGRSGVEDVITSAVPDPVAQTAVQKAFRDYNAAREREVATLRGEIQLYRTLSTAGITAAVFAHESNGNPLKVIDLSLNALEFKGKKEFGAKFERDLGLPLRQIRGAAASLNVLAAATLRIIDRDKRRVGRVDVHAVVGAVLDTFGPFFLGRRVAVMFEPAPAQPFMRGSPAALESIVTNLINNSLAAMEMTSSEERRILVRTSIPGDIVELEVQDSGTGIEGISMDDIWLPGESRRDGGTGLGLTIVRDSVADLGGTVEARAHGELGGALFTIQLPILGS